jgi:hypothetical protein
MAYPCARRVGEDRLQPANRRRGAFHRDFRDAANAPNLARLKPRPHSSARAHRGTSLAVARRTRTLGCRRSRPDNTCRCTARRGPVTWHLSKKYRHFINTDEANNLASWSSASVSIQRISNDRRNSMSQQSNWQFCYQCGGLFFAGHNLGVCPVGGGAAHDASQSGGYALSFSSSVPVTGTQSDWQYCKKCQGIFFAGDGSGFCPATKGAHEAGGGSGYALNQSGNGQAGWKYCLNCHGLFFAASSRNVCPEGGPHISGSGSYFLTQLGGASNYFLSRAHSTVKCNG